MEKLTTFKAYAKLILYVRGVNCSLYFHHFFLSYFPESWCKTLDKEEFRIKLEDINHLVEVKDYKGALEIVDSIDWRRVKNVRTLCVVGEIYAANKRYEDSRDIFLLAYHRSSLGKNILGRLIDISVKLGDFDEAREYYDEYRNIAPNDNTLYVLNYKILKGQNAPIQEQIAALEAYKKKEFTEKWSYELAKLYYQAGDKEKCKSVCDEMILWFSDGIYVMKALDLKMRMGIITEEEKKKLDKAFVPKLYTQDELRKLKEQQKNQSAGKKEEEDADDSSGRESSDTDAAEENAADEKDAGNNVSDFEKEDQERNLSGRDARGQVDSGGDGYERDSAEIEDAVKEDAATDDSGISDSEISDSGINDSGINDSMGEDSDIDDSAKDDATIEDSLESAFQPAAFKVPDSMRKKSFVEDDLPRKKPDYPLSKKSRSEVKPKGVKKYSEEDDDIPPLESTEDYYSDRNSYEEAEERDFPVIESIRVENERDLGTVETLQERITKGIRELFGGRKKNRPEKEEQEEDEFVDEREEIEEVSDLEKESDISKNNRKNMDFADLAEEDEKSDQDIKEPKEKKNVFSTIKLPELKFPKSFRRTESNKIKEKEKDLSGQEAEEEIEESAENAEGAGLVSDRILDENLEEETDEAKEAAEEAQEVVEEVKEDFNLEDTILAAATAQGIEIPGEEPDKPEPEETIPEEDIRDQKSGAVFSNSHDEEFTEEDLRQAEEEFMKGPGDTDNSNVPDLEPDDIVDLDEVVLDEEEEEFLKKIPEEENGEDVSDVSYETKGISVLDEDDEDEVKLSQKQEDSQEKKISLEEKAERITRDIKEKSQKLSSKEQGDFTENKNPAGNNPAERISEEEGPEKDSLKHDSSEEENLEKEDKEGQNKDQSEDNLTEEEKLEKFIESIHPEEEKDPLEIVIRDRELTEDEVKLFSYFVKIPGMKEQLLDSLIDVQKNSVDNTSKSGNVIVMGGNESGKTRLISSLIPAICKELNLTAAKQAYVFAEQINGKNINAIFEKLAGGFFVIENANQLDQATAEALNKAMEKETDGLIVILEDNKIGMRKLIARYPKLARKFTSLINIPVFTNDELAAFARVYALENGYKIDNMGMLALYNLIGENQKEDVPMNVGAVKKMIDAAIAKSKGGLRVFRKNADKKRLDKDGNILLFEKDFN